MTLMRDRRGGSFDTTCESAVLGADTSPSACGCSHEVDEQAPGNQADTAGEGETVTVDGDGDSNGVTIHIHADE